MSRLSFRQRLTLFSAAGIALVLVAGSVATYVAVRSQLDESLRQRSAAVVIRGEVDIPSLQPQSGSSSSRG
jgi:hypothetical protein